MPASVSTSIGACEPPRCEAIQAARHRSPLPDTSERLPSALRSRIETPASVREYMIRPSAPTPRWRSHTARASVGRSRVASMSRASIRMKSLPKACALTSGSGFICGRTRAGAIRSAAREAVAAR